MVATAVFRLPVLLVLVAQAVLGELVFPGVLEALPPLLALARQGVVARLALLGRDKLVVPVVRAIQAEAAAEVAPTGARPLPAQRPPAGEPVFLAAKELLVRVLVRAVPHKAVVPALRAAVVEQGR